MTSVAIPWAVIPDRCTVNTGSGSSRRLPSSAVCHSGLAATSPSQCFRSSIIFLRSLLQDLLKVKSGKLESFLRRLVDMCSRHVFDCLLCSSKGFYCELCRSTQCIFPFELDTVYRVSSSQSVLLDVFPWFGGHCTTCTLLSLMAVGSAPFLLSRTTCCYGDSGLIPSSQLRFFTLWLPCCSDCFDGDSRVCLTIVAVETDLWH